MTRLQVRTIDASERERVLDLLQEWLGDRAFFARYFIHDPSFRDDLCFVACDAGRIVSTLQVFRKQVRIGAQVLQVGCVGNVFTTAEYRGRGLASQLLRQSFIAMQQHGFDLSLLFATRLRFYGELGWCSHVRRLAFLESGASSAAGDYRIEPFTPAALPAVRAIYDRYAASFSGTTLRDAAYWHGQLAYAGNPREDFVLACQGQEVVAYARGTTLYDFYVIIEHAYLPGHQAGLVELVQHLHGGPAAGLPGTITHLAVEPEIRESLEQRGLVVRLVDDVFWMWRVIDVPRLAVRLGMAEAEVEADDFFFRILPPDRSLYFTADRF